MFSKWFGFVAVSLLAVLYFAAMLVIRLATAAVAAIAQAPGG